MGPSESKTRRPFALVPLIAFLTLLKVGGALWLWTNATNDSTSAYSYIGEDYPRAWPIALTGPVYMPAENSVRYATEPSPESDEDWSSAAPNNGIIYLGKERQPFSISMFHQIRCLDILRKEMWTAQKTGITKPDSLLNQHCLNYLRLSVLCGADTTLDMIAGHQGHAKALPDFFTCKNYSMVYDAVAQVQ
ncbi:hypothetical protein HMN09_00337700 [Mycena chlorophos]|uniref:Uncharacterized protein n=1 Tax=Mycena chlorophos TaxID=658473 RepID=A0A8H6TG76_MYCCL|nr:hypothetical protein HMN09_00337700 [Mycena chlorophos]